MHTFKELSNTELEIMEKLWQHQHPMSPSELLQYFNQEKKRSWKRQTLSTFLSRLSDKGLVLSEKKGREVYYHPPYDQKTYEQYKAKYFLSSEYQGSIQNFMAALYKDDINQEEIEKIKQWLDEQ